MVTALLLSSLVGCFDYDDTTTTVDKVVRTNSTNSTVLEKKTPIEIAKEIIEKENEESEAMVEFTHKAIDNSVSINSLYRQPDNFKGKEVYFSGSVVQTIYNEANSQKVELRVKVSDETDNNIIYVTHTIEDNQMRILEGDWVDIYGIFEGLITYTSTSDKSITIPAITSKYLYTTVSGDFEDTSDYKKAKEKIGGTFVNEKGKEISFPLNTEPDYYSLGGLKMYGTNIYCSYTPDIGWDENNPPPFYQMVIFEDGSIVVYDEKTEYTHYKPLKNIKTAYKAIITNKEVFVDKDFASYCVYDIDGDKQKELIVLSGACEADAILLFYKYVKKEAVCIGETSGGHCSICGNTKSNGITIHYGIQGVEWIDTAKIKNNRLKVTNKIPQREVYPYTEFEYCKKLEFCAIDDFSQLNKLK